ncbi:MAG TPA: DUF1254 domain-containing protein [Burkholderiaceae bacterium]|nr:DUF1254 domain-containing protein [Burkholderiaceae bacterium]
MKTVRIRALASASRVAAYFALVVAAYVAGLVSALIEYPRSEFGRTWEAVVRDRGANSWLHLRELSDETSRRLVRPNDDTLYSYAAVDLGQGPRLIEARASDRYWSVQFMRDNTDVFAYVGSRTLGLNRPARVLLVPADFSGDAKDLEVIRAPSRRVWLLARFLVDGADDLPRAHELQDGLRILPYGG